MYKIAVHNGKGGVGKSFLSVNLATGLASLGYKVILLDLDGQNDSTTHFFGIDNNLEEDNIYNAIVKNMPIDYVLNPINNNLYLISNSKYDDINNYLYYKDNDYFNKLFKPLEDKYDFIIIDTSPVTNSSINKKVLTYANEVIVPIIPEYLGVKGVSNMYDTLKEININGEKIKLVIPNMVQKNKTHTEGLELLNDLFKDKVKAVIPRRIAIAATSKTNTSVYDLKDKELENIFALIIEDILKRKGDI